MATQPLFVSSSTELKKQLRLSGLNADLDSDANELFEQGLQSAVVRFFSELSATQISDLQAQPFEENPTSQTAAIRMLANLTEIRLVKLELIRIMPVYFADSSASRQQDWNYEAPLVDSVAERERELTTLEAQVEDAFAILSGKKPLSGSLPKRVQVSTIGPSNPNYKYTPSTPGGTVFPKYPPGAYIPPDSGQ